MSNASPVPERASTGTNFDQYVSVQHILFPEGGTGCSQSGPDVALHVWVTYVTRNPRQMQNGPIEVVMTDGVVDR